MRPEENMLLNSRYRFVSRIALGGMGEVWKAHDEKSERDVAVKFLRDEFRGNEDFLERFRTEAKNTAVLSHEGIATLYDYGEVDGTGYLVMELIVAESLLDVLRNEKRLHVDRALEIVGHTARALQAAHDAGVIHRDIKPGNIMLLADGKVKITDFGISKIHDANTVTADGLVMGTAQYLSPEQAGGSPATPASDIYALGIVAYEMLVGYRPFTGSSALEIAMAHVDQVVPPMPDDVPADVSALVFSMLDKTPSKRPRNAASVAAEAERLAEVYRWEGDADPLVSPILERVPRQAPHVAPGRQAAHDEPPTDVVPIIREQKPAPQLEPAAPPAAAPVHMKRPLSPRRVVGRTPKTPPDANTTSASLAPTVFETAPEGDTASVAEAAPTKKSSKSIWPKIPNLSQPATSATSPQTKKKGIIPRKPKAPLTQNAAPVKPSAPAKTPAQTKPAETKAPATVKTSAPAKAPVQTKAPAPAKTEKPASTPAPTATKKVSQGSALVRAFTEPLVLWTTAIVLFIVFAVIGGFVAFLVWRDQPTQSAAIVGTILSFIRPV